MKKLKFYSQYGQDRYLYENYYKNKKSGVFLEIGADDGVDKSNTLFFEESMCWSGICIEPSPSRFELLKKNRNCVCECIAVSDYMGETQFLDILGWGKGLSGIIDNFNPGHLSRVNTALKNLKNLGSEKLLVQIDLLNNVLERNNLYEIDFCTIDTEGSEFEILKALDFNKYKIGIILVENNYDNIEVKKILSENNYEYHGKVGPIDDMFILREKERL